MSSTAAALPPYSAIDMNALTTKPSRWLGLEEGVTAPVVSMKGAMAVNSVAIRIHRV